MTWGRPDINVRPENFKYLLISPAITKDRTFMSGLRQFVTGAGTKTTRSEAVSSSQRGSLPSSVSRITEPIGISAAGAQSQASAARSPLATWMLDKLGVEPSERMQELSP